jgi:hypothetical protein
MVSTYIMSMEGGFYREYCTHSIEALWPFGTTYGDLIIEKTSYIEKYPDAFAALPPIMQDACTRNSKRFSFETKCILEGVHNARPGMLPFCTMFHVKQYTEAICDSLYLSPQTEEEIVSANYQLMQGISINRADPKFIYNAENELENKRKILSVAPSILQDLCMARLDQSDIYNVFEPNQFIRALYRMSQKVPLIFTEDCSYSVVFHAKELCNEVQMSPQTEALVIDACRQLAKGNVLSDVPLVYNEQFEKENNIKLIERMPTIIRDICLKNPERYECYRLIKKVFAGAKCIDSVGQSYRNFLTELLRHESLSPQTIARLFHEFKDVLKGEIAPFHPRDETEEARNKQVFIAQFSPELRALYMQSPKKPVHDRLLYQAYVLSHPKDMPLFMKGFLAFISVVPSVWEKNYEHYIEGILKEICGFYTYDPASIKQHVQTFITTFGNEHIKSTVAGLIAKRFMHHCGRICAPYAAAREQIQKQLESNRVILDMLLIEPNVDQLTPLKNAAYIDERLCNGLEPACSVCFETFADYMTPIKSSIVGTKYQLLCNHPLCSTCYKHLESKLCPICRRSI